MVNLSGGCLTYLRTGRTGAGIIKVNNSVTPFAMVNLSDCCLVYLRTGRPGAGIATVVNWHLSHGELIRGLPSIWELAEQVPDSIVTVHNSVTRSPWWTCQEVAYLRTGRTGAGIVTIINWHFHHGELVRGLLSLPEYWQNRCWCRHCDWLTDTFAMVNMSGGCLAIACLITGRTGVGVVTVTNWHLRHGELIRGLLSLPSIW